MEDRGDLDPAPPARHPAAAAAAPPEAELGGPGPHSDPAQRDTKVAAPRAAAAGHPGNDPALARDIVRRRWAAKSMRGKTGRPATRRNIQTLVRRLARENPGWGYRRIHGERAGLGVKVAASTVWEILKASGIGPARRLTGPTWSQFLRSQAGAILASDFFTADLLDGTQAYVLAVIEHASRRIRILGPARVRDPPQSPPASPVAGRSRTAQTATRTGRSRPVPRPKADPHRLPDQRVPPGRMTWMRFSARTA